MTTLERENVLTDIWHLYQKTGLFTPYLLLLVIGTINGIFYFILGLFSFQSDPFHYETGLSGFLLYFVFYIMFFVINIIILWLIRKGKLPENKAVFVFIPYLVTGVSIFAIGLLVLSRFPGSYGLSITSPEGQLLLVIFFIWGFLWLFFHVIGAPTILENFTCARHYTIDRAFELRIVNQLELIVILIVIPVIYFSVMLVSYVYYCRKFAGNLQKTTPI
ncbi:MAG: hypothetical protein ACFFD4_04915 [Candidatus Odinarchaeota archaeon]